MDGIEIFRTGQHTAVNGTTITVTPEILAGMAASYDRSVHEAPMVVGHPKSNAPAYGWVSGLIVDGDRLIAAPDQVDAEFEEMVRTGRFKKRSPSFYLPDNPSNPKPGTYYLRHVGFLGAQPPAVKGLKDIAFAEDPDALEFADWDALAQVQLMRNLRDFLIGQFGQDKADQVLPSDLLDQLQFSAAQPCPDPDPDPIIPNFGEKPDMATAEELAERERLLTERETKLAKDGVTLRRGAYADFADSLIREGVFPGGERDNLVSFMETVDAEPVDFAEGDATVQKAPIDWFKSFLRGLPKRVSTGETGAGEAATDFAETDNVQTAIGNELASAKAAGREISPAEAVSRLRIKGVIK